MNFISEFKRVFLHQYSSRRIFTIYFLPILVAVLIFIAFGSDPAYGKKGEFFIFFTTLYSFWIGLFSGSQLVNVEVKSGEWAYWVLGFNRSAILHLFSLALSSIVLAFIQFFMMSFTLAVIDICVGNDVLHSAYLNRSEFESGIRILTSLSFVKIWLPLLILFLSSILASISGVGVGLLFSCIFTEPGNSIKAAIAFVVFVLLSSHTVIKSSEDKSKYSPIYVSMNSTHCELAVTTHFKSQKRDSKNQTGICVGILKYGPFILEDLSYLHPQRYFFNVGRLFDSSIFAYKGSHSNSSYNCHCIKECFKGIDEPTKTVWQNVKNGKDEYLKSDKKVISKLLCSFFGKTLFYEVLVLMGQFFICVSISLLIVNTRKIYYELR